MRTKRNLKLFALTCVQANNQNEKRGTTLPPCLDKVLLFEGKKGGEGKGKQNVRILPG